MINYNMIIILLLYTLIYSSIFKVKINQMIKSLAITITLGMIITLLFIVFNVYLYVDYYILLLIPILIMLYYFVDTRYLCLAYSYPIYVCIVEFFNISTNCNIPSYIFLVGVIHLVEGILIMFDDSYKEVETYDVEIDLKGNIIKCKTFSNALWIVPAIIPIIVNYQLYEIITMYDINVIELINVSNGDIFFTTMLLMITYKQRKNSENKNKNMTNEKVERNSKDIKRKSDSIKLICFAIFAIFISRLISYETILATNFQYISLLSIVFAHELMCNRKMVR